MANMNGEIVNKPYGPLTEFKSKSQALDQALKDSTHDVGEKIGAMTADLKQQASDYVKSGKDYVKDNPLKGVAIAAATGAVVGWLFTLAMRRQG